MKRIVPLLALLMVFGLAATAFATQNENDGSCTTSGCSQSELLHQSIRVNVPTVLRFVIDDGLNRVNNWLPSWNINLDPNAGTVEVNDCYVVPNWVDNSNLKTFMQNNAGGLLKADPSWGYPPVISFNGKNVATWAEVASQLDSETFTLGGGYTNSELHAQARAKGNLVCTNQYAFEVYTNCPNATLRYSLTHGGNPAHNAGTGFGTLFYNDHITKNGIAGWSVDRNITFTSADGTKHTLLGHVTPGIFFDNLVSQALWLRSSSPNNYYLYGTYTLGDPTAQ